MSAFLVGLSTAGAAATSAGPLILSPRSVDFGTAFHAGEKRSASVTVSNQGNLPRLLRRTSIREAGDGCRSFGSVCPLRIVQESGSCPSSGRLGQGQQCQVTLSFAPASAGDLAVSLCLESYGPIGDPLDAVVAPSTVTSCVPVKAHVLAAAPGAVPHTGTSAPGSASPAKPPAAKPSAPTTGKPAPTPVSSPGSKTSQPTPPPIRLAWQSAGAFVWNPDNLDPTRLGQQMRANGFGWVAIRIQDGMTADQIDPTWIAQFKKASGLPVGGWGVLRDQPVQEAQLAGTVIGKLKLGFYIADAEAEYEYSNQSGHSAQRFGRSAVFVQAFRVVEPQLPAALSSYCRADQHDIDWQTWRDAGFAFMPQAYVDQFGSAAAPVVCAAGAGGFFAPGDVHPTLGTFLSSHPLPSPTAYGQMLSLAGTVGFSLYLAENVPDKGWKDYGQAITTLGIAR